MSLCRRGSGLCRSYVELHFFDVVLDRCEIVHGVHQLVDEQEPDRRPCDQIDPDGRLDEQVVIVLELLPLSQAYEVAVEPVVRQGFAQTGQQQTSTGITCEQDEVFVVPPADGVAYPRTPVVHPLYAVSVRLAVVGSRRSDDLALAAVAELVDVRVHCIRQRLPELFGGFPSVEVLVFVHSVEGQLEVVRIERQVLLDGHLSLPEELALLDDLLHLRVVQEAVLRSVSACLRRESLQAKSRCTGTNSSSTR